MSDLGREAGQPSERAGHPAYPPGDEDHCVACGSSDTYLEKDWYPEHGTVYKRVCHNCGAET